MKNQYFGDNRDLFKYDLIYQIIRAGLVDNFTLIPMLTGNDNTGYGGKFNRHKAKAGTKNKSLINFLDKCVREGRRGVRQLKNFFEKYDINMKIYENNFSHQHRQEYFRQIKDEYLVKSIIFVDPDIGLEVKQPGEKHILYSEVENLYKRMDKGSILMICQHFPRIEHQQYLNMRCTELKEKITGDYPVCIDDDEIAFFFLVKDKSLEESLIKVVRDYSECYS
jgi:hypothetical protein